MNVVMLPKKMNSFVLGFAQYGRLSFLSQVYAVVLNCLLLVSIALYSLPAYARDYYPHMLYYAPWFVPVFSGFHDTLAAAYAEAKASFEALYPGSSVTSQYPAPFQVHTINGIPTAYRQDYIYNGYSDWTGAVIATYECANDLRDFAINTIIGAYDPGVTQTLIAGCTDDSVINVAPDVDGACSPAVTAVGKPIYPALGFEQVIDTIYQANGFNALAFTLTYRSDLRAWRNNYQIAGIDFTSIQQVLTTQNMSWPSGNCYPGIGSKTGRPVCHPYKIKTDSNGVAQVNDFAVMRGNNRMLNFGTATDLSPTTPDINDRVTKITAVDGSTIGL